MSDPQHEKALLDALSFLEQIQDLSPSRHSVSGTIWLLKNRLQLVSSLLLKRAEEQQDGSPNKSPLSECLSDASTRAGLSSSPAGASTSSSSDRTKAPLTLTASRARKELPVSACFRTRYVERRFSGDAEEFHSQFKARCNSLHRRCRRRKSLSQETLDLAAAQGLQLNALRDTTAHHSNPTPSPIGLTYRRSRSAVTMSSMELSSPEANRNQILRQQSLTCVSNAMEIWPESITALLTGGQIVLDRALLFGQLADSLKSTTQQSFWPGATTRRTAGLRTLSGGISIPRPDKKWGGEDAFFLCDESDGFVGVADGVGEWGELGCNPRQFAEELMSGAREEALRLHREGQEGLSFNAKNASSRTLQVLSAGFRATRSFGSSTALVAGMDVDGRMLGIANMGDSTCLVLRRESKRHRHFISFRRTKEQQHFFNCPYQLSKVPKPEDLPGLASRGMHGLVRALSNLSSRLEGDTPEMADLYDIHVQQGDLLIIATDGVFDNLFDQEIANLVSLAISPREANSLTSPFHPFPHPNVAIPPIIDPQFGVATPPQKIAQAVAEAAFYRSLDPRARTPFARQSRRAGGFFAGGKMDDITCVAVWIV